MADGRPSLFDPRDVAWLAAKRSYLDLTEPERELVDGFVEILRSGEHDDGLHDGCAPAQELEDAAMALAAGEINQRTIDAIAQLLGVDEDELDADAVKQHIEAAREEGTKDATIPSRANTAQRKALRLLVDGHVTVQRVVHEGELAGLIVGEVRGDSGDIYVLGFDPKRKQWRCTCPELRGQCSHLTALKMITRTPN